MKDTEKSDMQKGCKHVPDANNLQLDKHHEVFTTCSLCGVRLVRRPIAPKGLTRRGSQFVRIDGPKESMSKKQRLQKRKAGKGAI
jgi:hypothetical protein